MTWFDIGGDEDWDAVSVDSEHAAEAICRVAGESWSLLGSTDRDRYREMAEAAIVAIGGERQC